MSPEFRDDKGRAWEQNGLTAVDAFYHYYSRFTRDQDYFEANVANLQTPVRIVWGAEDIYIKKGLGMEFAQRINATMTLLPGAATFPICRSRN